MDASLKTEITKLMLEVGSHAQSLGIRYDSLSGTLSQLELDNRFNLTSTQAQAAHQAPETPTTTTGEASQTQSIRKKRS